MKIGQFAFEPSAFNLQRFSQTYLKAFMNVKMIGLLAGLVIILYMIGYDTVFAPNWKKITLIGDTIGATQQQLRQAEAQKGEFSRLIQQVKELPTQVRVLTGDEAPKIVAVGETKKIIDLIKAADTGETALPPPHNSQEFVSIADKGEELVNVNPAPEGAEQPQPSSEDGSRDASGGPGPMGGPPGGAPGGLGGPAPVPAAPVSQTPLYLTRFKYDLVVNGTYAALANVINKLVMSPGLVVIDKIELSKPNDPLEPDAATQPDYPVKLSMTLSISLYLYDPKRQSGS